MNKIKAFFVSVGKWFKKVGIAIGKWFANWFVEVDGKPNHFIKIGRWVKSFFTQRDSGGKTKFGKLLTSAPSKSLYASLICILCGMLVGLVLLFVTSLFNPDISIKNAFDGFRVIVGSIFYKKTAQGVLIFGFNADSIGDMLFRATPILMTGLSVAFAFKAGLFNIGAAGQYLVGTCAALYIALSIPQTVLPTWLIWILAFGGAIIAGMLWGAIPGLFKTLFNTNEVITCIMTNWIAANLVTMIFDSSALKNVNEAGKSGFIKPTSVNGIFNPSFGLRELFGGSYADGGIIIAIAIAIFMFVIVYKSKFGYELRATGLNRQATRYAGMNEKKNIILSMAIAGGLAAAGAALYCLNGRTEFAWSTYTSLPTEGFNGIPVALLASSNPIAIIFSSLFMAYLNIGGNKLTVATAFNEHIANIMIAVIVYFSGFSKFFIDLFNSNKKVKHLIDKDKSVGKDNKIEATTATDNAIIKNEEVEK